jgi:hypothetical protein
MSYPEELTLAVSPQALTIPLEVIVITADFEIKGFVHVSRASRDDRRITDLLNATEKRFLAITNAQLIARRSASSVRHYAFIQVHVDSVQMVHPSAQSLLNHGLDDDAQQRYNALRSRATEFPA